MKSSQVHTCLGLILEAMEDDSYQPRINLTFAVCAGNDENYLVLTVPEFKALLADSPGEPVKLTEDAEYDTVQVVESTTGQMALVLTDNEAEKEFTLLLPPEFWYTIEYDGPRILDSMTKEAEITL